MFSCEFFGIFKKTFFTEQLQWLLLDLRYLALFPGLELLFKASLPLTSNSKIPFWKTHFFQKFRKPEIALFSGEADPELIM